MKTVIMAGGKGTRIASVASDIPKPMIKINGKPILEYEIECLRNQGFNDIILTIGHLGKSIKDYFGDGDKISPCTGEKFGVHIEYFFEEEPLGNAGALFKIKDKLTQDFLLLNGDIVFDIDFNRFVTYHLKKGGKATLFTHPNSHPYDSGIVIANDKKMVTKWLTKEDDRNLYYKNRVNAGIHILSIDLLKQNFGKKKIDLDRDLLKPLANKGVMYVYDSPEYVKDMGTPERYQNVCKDFQEGKIKAKNLLNKQKAIFLDRDGTINQYVGFLKDINQFKLIKGVEEAVKKINQQGYLAIVVTNQPVIARGEISIEQLEEIHNKMETILGLNGAYIDAIYYCPHHPDRGYKGERIEYKVSCECRKPKSGMILQAAEDYNINLSQSWMIGDSENDIKAGIGAGCKTALIGVENYGQDYTVKNLRDFINKIF